MEKRSGDIRKTGCFDHSHTLIVTFGKRSQNEKSLWRLPMQHGEERSTGCRPQRHAGQRDMQAPETCRPQRHAGISVVTSLNIAPLSRNKITWDLKHLDHKIQGHFYSWVIRLLNNYTTSTRTLCAAGSSRHFMSV